MCIRRPALLFALSLWLSASPAQDWVGDLRTVTLWTSRDGRDMVYALLDEDNNVVKVVPNVRSAADFPVPIEYRDDSMGSAWRDGRLYTLAYGDEDRDAEGAPSQLWTFAMWEDGKWHHLGGIRSGPWGLLNAIPCDDGRFIVISSRAGMLGAEGPDPTPFRVASLPLAGKDMRLGRAMDHGQDGLRRHMSESECFKLAWFSRIMMTDSHAVLVNFRTGLYWVFSLEKASLVKAGCIFKKVTPKMIAKGGFPDAVLCADAEKAGTVLVAAQDEDFFMTEKGDAEREFSEMVSGDAFDNSQAQWEAADREYERRRLEIIERNPFIVWYRIHPESGRVEKLYDPPEGGTFFRDAEKSGGFRAMADGSIRMGGGGGNSTDLEEQARQWLGKAGKKQTTGETKSAEPDLEDEGPADGDAPPEDNAAGGGADKDRAAGEGGAPAA
jgi:hypothetical protein